MEKTDTLTWLTEELRSVNATDTLNARFHASLEHCDDSLQEITLRFPLEQWEINGIGTLHGGILSAMLDLTMCMVVYCYSRTGVPPTVTMTTNYLRPVPMEGSVLIRARLTSLGRRNATAYGEAVIPASGKLAGTAVGTYAVVRNQESGTRD